MSAEELAVLQQVVVAKAAESSAPTELHVASAGRGEGPESRGKRRWGRRRTSDGDTDNLDNPTISRTPKSQQQNTFQEFHVSHGVRADAASQQGSECKSSAKSPNSSKGPKSSLKSKKPRKSKDKPPGAGEEYELDGLNEVEEQKEHRKFYEKRKFWTLQLPLAWTLALGFIGIMLRVFSPFRTASHVQLWRFFLFLAFLPPIYVVANYILLAIVWFFETQFFTTTNVLYFVIALKSPARYVLMSLLLLPLYIPLFLPQSTLSAGANTAYHRVLSLIASVIVFNAMNFLKVLFAKLMSSYFHSSTHFMKMQEALDKEYYLKVLSTPRQEGNTFLDMLKPDGEANGVPPEKKTSKLGKTAPGRFVSKMALAASLQKVPQLTRRGGLLPRAASLDNLVGRSHSHGGVDKQGEPRQHRPADLAIPEASDRRISFEPPDPVPPTPHGTVQGGGPAAPSPVAYLSKASVPVAGQRAGSTARNNTGNGRASPVVRFQQSLSLQKKEKDSEGQEDRANDGQLMRRNTDGGAGLAGILQDIEMATGQDEKSGDPLSHGLPAGSHFRKGSQASEDHEMKSSRKGSRSDSTSAWAKHRRLDRSVTAIREEKEHESPGRLPTTAEEMTNEQGVALVATIHQVEKHLRKRQMNIPFTDQLTGAGVTSEQEARKLAFFIFWNVKPFFDRNYIMQSDLEAFLSPKRAAEAFEMLDRDGDNQVTLTELRSSIVEIFNERANLSLQLRDTKSVVRALPPSYELYLCRCLTGVSVYPANSEVLAKIFAKLRWPGSQSMCMSGSCQFRSSLYSRPCRVSDVCHSLLTLAESTVLPKVGKLELVIGVALHVCAIFFYLMIFGVDIQHVWVLFTSIFLGFAFIFGNSIKNLFEAVLYLFVQHPFDVGDILLLDKDERVKVEEISLSTIVMRRGDGVRLWVPTTQLVPKTCQNITRSDNKAEGFKFLVDVGVSTTVLQEVEKRVGQFIESRETDFVNSHSVHLTACGDPLKVALNVNFEFSHNGVDIGKLSQAKSDLLQVVSDTLAELKVVNTQAPLRSFNES